MPYRPGTFLSGIFACSMYFVPQAPIRFKLLFPAWGLWTTIEVIMHDGSGRGHRDDCVSWASAFQSSPTWQLVFVQTASRAKPQTRYDAQSAWEPQIPFRPNFSEPAQP